MLKFNDFLNEEMMPFAISDGRIDIEDSSVRDQINGYLASVTSSGSVTPYNILQKVRKALAYFHIQLPKRAYMEGAKGVEVWNVMQFGDKMGMNNDGEFVRTVPSKFYLFFSYQLMGASFFIRAKLVDKAELDKEISGVEASLKESSNKSLGSGMKKYKFWNKSSWDNGDPRNVKKRLKDNPELVKSSASRTEKLSGPAELQRRLAKKMTDIKEELDAESQQNRAKVKAPKEEIKHLEGKAVKVMRKQINEVSKEKLLRYVNKAHAQIRDPKTPDSKAVKRVAGQEKAAEKMLGRAKVPAK